MEIPETRLLYYDDAYQRKFEAEVLQVGLDNGKTSMVLDRTAFYPTGGGQPSDRGIIEGENSKAGIVEVRWNEGRILHIEDGVNGNISQGDYVKGAIDWDRRYSLMRNHTGAHVMAEAVRRVLESPVEVVGSGLDVDKVRLDFALASSLRPVFHQIEEVANRLVKENRRVQIKIMSRDEAKKHVERFHENLRTLPSGVSQVRVVEVEGVHACACGGTHVKATGEIGTIRILGRSSKGKDVERLQFRAQSP